MGRINIYPPDVEVENVRREFREIISAYSGFSDSRAATQMLQDRFGRRSDELQIRFDQEPTTATITTQTGNVYSLDLGSPRTFRAEYYCELPTPKLLSKLGLPTCIKFADDLPVVAKA